MATRRLRMNPQLLYVLLCLSEGERHGYAVLSEVEERSRGAVKLGPSSLYYTLGRLEDAGLIRESKTGEAAGEDEPHAEQRRYFAITEAGRDRLEEEFAVLRGLMDHARTLGLGAQG